MRDSVTRASRGPSSSAHDGYTTATAPGRRRFEVALATLLAPADVHLNGDRPWDLRVHDPRFYMRAMRDGSLGVGESYMDGWWSCDALEEMFYRVLRARLDERVGRSRAARLLKLAARFKNLQGPRRAFQIGQRHYDLGNDLFERMLDRRMVYSCGYWADARTLDEAQEAKLDLVCRKLGLEPGMRLLDVGCGWGSLVQYAAENYGVSAVGVTVSREQHAYAAAACAHLPVEIRLQDYRELDEPFDRIASIGMFEHVGYRNHRTFMEVARRCLADDGLLLLHTIGSNHSIVVVDAWIHRYVFPNGLIPSMRQIAEAAEGLLVLEDWHSFGVYYHRTLQAWHDNFSMRWSEIADRYGERFFRMWTYYLHSTAAGFRARRNQVWQMVFSRSGLPGGYASVR